MRTTGKGNRRIKAAALAIVVALTCAAGDMAGRRFSATHRQAVAATAQRSE